VIYRPISRDDNQGHHYFQTGLNGIFEFVDFSLDYSKWLRHYEIVNSPLPRQMRQQKEASRGPFTEPYQRA